MVKAVPEKLANFVIDEKSTFIKLSSINSSTDAWKAVCQVLEVKRGQENGVAEYVIWTSRTMSTPPLLVTTGMRSPIRYPLKRRVFCKFCCAKFFV